MDLQPGQVALITGGASGIGLGIARAFGDAGLAVAIADVDVDALEHSTAELTAAGFINFSVTLDVTDAASWKHAVDQVWDRFGRIDILCNNAGIGQGRREKGEAAGLINMSESSWRLIFETNTTGVFLGAHEVVPRIAAQGRPGHIVNTASMAGLIAPSGLGAYAASKFAVVALSESLRSELAPIGIGVSVLCPGGVESRLNASTEARHAAAAGRPVVSTNPPGVTLMSAESVGHRVLEAIRSNRLHIITHPEYRPLVEERHLALLSAFGTSAESGYRDPEPLLRSSRNPCYADAFDPPKQD